MKLFLERNKANISASADYNKHTGELTVLKGSKLSNRISYTEKFRSAKSIEESRKGVVKNDILQKNVTFKSASTAANFVTGSSTNGLIAWKDSEGRTLKDIRMEQE